VKIPSRCLGQCFHEFPGYQVPKIIHLLRWIVHQSGCVSFRSFKSRSSKHRETESIGDPALFASSKHMVSQIGTREDFWPANLIAKGPQTTNGRGGCGPRAIISLNCFPGILQDYRHPGSAPMPANVFRSPQAGIFALHQKFRACRSSPELSYPEANEPRRKTRNSDVSSSS